MEVATRVAEGVHALAAVRECCWKHVSLSEVSSRLLACSGVALLTFGSMARSARRAPSSAGRVRSAIRQPMTQRSRAVWGLYSGFTRGRIAWDPADPEIFLRQHP